MIELKNVTKIYPRKGESDVHALDGITLRVRQGEIHGIVGQSGAGKSTLIRCLTALEKPTSGKILVDGKNLATLSPSELRTARRSIGMVFQGANLLDARTAAGNVVYPLRISGMDRGEARARVDEMLRLVGLSDRGTSYPAQLSGGQRQRVAIARAMADNPSVLLCDEPTSALDTETTEQILSLLRDVRDRYGVTVVIITHEMNVVRRICDSVTLLEHGRVVSTGPVGQAVSCVDTPLARQIVPAPILDPEDVKDRAVLDVFFTSRLGQPTGAKVMKIAADLGADIGAGTFDSIKDVQVGRLALTIEHDKVQAALDGFAAAGVFARQRTSGASDGYVRAASPAAGEEEAR